MLAIGIAAALLGWIVVDYARTKEAGYAALKAVFGLLAIAAYLIWWS